jgi:hypothetical protein
VPSAIVWGLVLGVVIRDRRSLVRAVVVGVVASAALGVLVGYVASSLVVGFAGAGLGAVNYAVGAAVGAGGRAVVRLAVAR